MLERELPPVFVGVYSPWTRSSAFLEEVSSQPLITANLDGEGKCEM
jgi:hypothetical protein